MKKVGALPWPHSPKNTLYIHLVPSQQYKGRSKTNGDSLTGLYNVLANRQEV